MYRAKIVSVGYYLPSKILTNKDLEKLVDTSDEWITTRTGIKERHIAAENEPTSSMGVKAARRALEKAGIKPEEIDVIVCATITPDYLFPSTACVIQKELHLVNAFAFDLSAACSGFIYALSVAETLLLQDRVKTVLVVAAEKLSCITDWKDRSTCVLFGDGAGAAILKKEKGKSGILSTYLGSDGSLGDLLILPAGGSCKPASSETIRRREHYIKMEGEKIFKVAVQKMLVAANKAIKLAGVKVEDVKLFIPHQANLRIINAIAKRLNFGEDKIFINLDKTGNTSAASTAISLSQAEEKGLIEKDDVVVLATFGAGFTWAGMVLRW